MTGQRVVRVITRLNIGGPARHALILTRRLNAEFPTTLVAGTPPEVEGELIDPAVPVRRVHLVRPIRPEQDLSAYRAIRRIMAEARPALVHTHLAKAGLLGRLAARSALGRNVRTVHTFHGHVLEGYFPGPVSRAFIEMERRLAADTDLLVSVSEQIRDDLLRLRIGRAEQHRVVPLGLELDPFLQMTGPTGRLRSQIGVGPDVPLIGVVGRLVRIKNHEAVLGALSYLEGAHLAVIGDGPMRRSLGDKAAATGLGQRVHFAGWIHDMPAALADLDVVALASRNEGTPVALIEAGAAARPVVATDVGGVRSVVQNGATGYLVPSGDIASMAERIARLLADRQLANQLGTTARQEIAIRFGSDRLVEDVANLYRELL